MDGGENQELALFRGTPDLEWKPEYRASICCGRPLDGPPQRTWSKVQGATGFVFVTNRVTISSRFCSTTSLSIMSADSMVCRNNAGVSVLANSNAIGP